MKIRSYLLPIFPFVTLAATGIAQANLIQNGGFENGLAGWTSSTFASSQSGVTARTGSSIGSGDFLFTGVSPGSFQFSDLKQTIASTQGQQLRLEFDVSATGVGTFYVRQLYADLSTSIDVVTFPNIVSGHKSFDFTAGADNITISFWFFGSTAGQFDLDNVSVTAIPAPGAIALLGLAGLTRRSRR
jgi:MYXO-CTERM domain-containing protein